MIYQPKTFKSPNITVIKSVVTEHPNNSPKLSNAKTVGSNSSLYSDTKNE